ncbi:MAG: DUF1566 domain-containing protein [Proteobacteria bacterium]|nr:DUF1566 domain-containing protein [Pseudomonadota bacterium]MBU1715113.1 DUF1566 domain-containing protein [Pseudomonadota bacterium]
MKALPNRLTTTIKIHPVLGLALVTLAALVTLGVGVAHADPPFVDNGDGTVTDTSTGLMWDQCTAGLSGAGCATGVSVSYSWAGAMDLAATRSTANYKGYSDWRLPSFVELRTLVKTGSSPTIDTTAFPNTVASGFWSGSSYVPSPAAAWAVGFAYGFTNAGNKTFNYYVRLVRGGQYFGSFALLPGGVAGTTTTTTTLSATSPVNGSGYWLVVPYGATPPTPAQVIAGVSYGSVTVAAAGTGAMTGKTLKTFAVTGLAVGTGYDLYLVATETTTGYASQLVGPVSFATLAISAGSIVIDPATPTTIYSGLDSAGIYKSTDSGANWTGASTQPTNLRVKELVILPGDSTKLYAATYGSGIFTSSDSGDTWDACANTNLTNLNVVSLAIDATGKLYAGTEAGVFVSTDDCANWQEMNNGLPN